MDDFDLLYDEVQGEIQLDTPSAGTPQAPVIDDREPFSTDEEYRSVSDNTIPPAQKADAGFFSGVRNSIQYLGNRYNMGQITTIQGAVIADDLINNNGKNYESLRDEYSTDRLTKIQKQVGNLDGMLALPGITRAIGVAAESLPFMIESTMGGLKAAPVGALAGAGAGAAYGAAVGAVNPAPGPEDVVTVGGGAIAGAARGFGYAWTAGTGLTSAKIMFGQTYQELRDAGVSHDVAKPASMAAGGIMGLIETLQVKGLGQAGKATLVGTLKSEGGRQVVREFLKDYAKEVGWQTTEEVLQEATAVATEFIVNEVEDGTSLDERLTVEALVDRFRKTTIDGLTASAVLVGGSKAAGSAAGQTGKAAMSAADLGKAAMKSQIASDIATKAKESRVVAQGAAWTAKVQAEILGRVSQGKMTVQDGISLFKEEFIENKPTQEAVEAVKKLNISDTVDSVANQLFDEQGEAINPQAGETLKAGVTKEVTGDTTQLDSNNTGGSVATDKRDNGGNQSENNAVREGQQPLEVDARREQISTDLASVDKEIAQLEKQFTETDTATTRKAEITKESADLKARQQRIKQELRRTKSDRVARKKTGQQETDLDKKEARLIQEQQATETALAALATEKAKVDQQVGSTKTLVTKLEKLYDQRDNLSTEQSLINEITQAAKENPTPENLAAVGSLVDYIGKEKGRLTVGRITNMRAKAAKAAISKFKAGVKKGAAQAKAEMAGVRSELGSLIRRADIPVSDKRKLQADFGRIQTVDQMIKALPEIERQIRNVVERAGRKEARSRITKALKAANLKKKSDKRPQGNFTADEQKVLDKYKEVIGIARKAENADKGQERGDVQLANRAQELALKRLAGEKLTADEALEQDIITAVIGNYGFQNKTAAELRQLASDIEALVIDGKIRAGVRQQQKAQRAADEIVNAIQAIQGDKPLPETGLNQPLRKNIIEENLESAARSFYEHDSWQGKMDIISQHDPDRGMKTLGDVFPAKVNEKRFIRVAVDRVLIPNLQRAAGAKSKTGLMRKFNQMSQTHRFGKPIVAGDHIDGSGKIQALHLSELEAVDLWMKFQDPSLRESLQNDYTFRQDVTSGIGKSTEQVLDEYLSDEGKAIGEALLQFYRDYHGRVSTFYRDKAGVDLPFNEFYSPLSRTNYRTDAKNMLLEESKLRFGLMPSAAQTRVDSSLRIQPGNAIDIVQRHIMQWEHAIAWDETITRLNNIFHDPQVKNLIKNKYGDRVLTSIHAHLESFITNRAYVIDQSLMWVETLRRNLITASLGLKTVSQAAKQLTSLIAYIDDVSIPDYIRGLAEVVNDPIHVFDTLSKSEYMRARGVTSDRDLNEITKAGRYAVLGDKTTRVKAMETMMIGTRVGDRGAIYIGGWSVYSSVLRKTGDPVKAMEAFERATDAAQQSGDIDQLSDTQRGNSLQRTFTTFMTSQFQYQRKEIAAIRGFMQASKGDPVSFAKATYKALRTLAVYRILLPAFFEFVSNGFNIDDEDMTRILVLGNFNNAFIVGDYLEYIYTTAWNLLTGEKKRGYPPSDLISDMMMMATGQKALKELAKAFETQTDEDIYDAAEKVAETAGILTGLPAETGIFMSETLIEWMKGNMSDEAAVTAAMGWPRSVVDRINENSDNK